MSFTPFTVQDPEANSKKQKDHCSNVCTDTIVVLKKARWHRKHLNLFSSYKKDLKKEKENMIINVFTGFCCSQVVENITTYAQNYIWISS